MSLNSSSFSSSDSDSDNDSSGEGVKSDESEEEEVKDETDAGESMETAVNKPKITGTSSEEKPSEEGEKSTELVPSSHQRTEVEGDAGAVIKSQSSEVPASGVYDPTYPSMTLHIAVKVMEYLESIQHRLITASLSVEVSTCNVTVYLYVSVHVHIILYVCTL